MLHLKYPFLINNVYSDLKELIEPKHSQLIKEVLEA